MSLTQWTYANGWKTPIQGSHCIWWRADQGKQSPNRTKSWWTTVRIQCHLGKIGLEKLAWGLGSWFQGFKGQSRLKYSWKGVKLWMQLSTMKNDMGPTVPQVEAQRLRPGGSCRIMSNRTGSTLSTSAIQVHMLSRLWQKRPWICQRGIHMALTTDYHSLTLETDKKVDETEHIRFWHLHLEMERKLSSF